MNIFSYKIEHDYGFAPNPFGKYCTLANCKSDIRRNKNLSIGDWVIGTGSVKLKLLKHLIYAMQVEEKLTFDEYWMDARFQYKKPVLNGSLVQMYGDNIYHFDARKNDWIQEDSAHSLINGLPNKEHLLKDTNGKNVLISSNFYYFGTNAIKIPERFLDVCSNGRSVKWKAIPPEVAEEFISWLIKSKNTGINGDPINWKEHFRIKA
jgi:hypothetical protein